MATLARPIGLGLAARGDIDDVTRWARQARNVCDWRASERALAAHAARLA